MSDSIAPGRQTSQYSHLVRVPSRIEQAVSDPTHPSNLSAHEALPFNSPPPRLTINHDRPSRVGPEVNVSDRFELFLLGEGEKKITEAVDTRTPNTSLFTINKEDHTLGNLLRAHLLKDPHVMFAGYKVPHPLFAKFELRVQTDGEITPKDAIISCCKAIVSDLGHLSREFTKEFELRKMVGGTGNPAER